VSAASVVKFEMAMLSSQFIAGVCATGGIGSDRCGFRRRTWCTAAWIAVDPAGGMS
jgi:hypothetical protein